MGVVYRARQTQLNRLVALKMILSGQLAGEEEVRRFYAEAEAAAKLHHPNIVPIFDVGEAEGRHFYSMAFIEGATLSKLVEQGPITGMHSADLTSNVAEAIAFAHTQGFVHRDLKPGNILLDERGEPCMTDFGLAKRTDVDSGLTGTG